MSIDDSVSDLCPMCAIESRLEFVTDRPWSGDERKLKEAIGDLAMQKQSGHHGALTPGASESRSRARPTLLTALGAMRRARAYMPPKASDYFSY